MKHQLRTLRSDNPTNVNNTMKNTENNQTESASDLSVSAGSLAADVPVETAIERAFRLMDDYHNEIFPKQIRERNDAMLPDSLLKNAEDRRDA